MKHDMTMHGLIDMAAEIVVVQKQQQRVSQYKSTIHL